VTYRLLVLEESAVPAEASVCAALREDGTFRCELLRWDPLAADGLRRSDADAMIAVGIPQTAAVVSAFEWLRDHPLGIPIFAVLSADAEDPLLRIATESVDDFVFAPIRPDELRHRLARVLAPSRHDAEAVHWRLAAEIGLTELVGSDPAFVGALAQVPRYARSDMPVLITGETGTGKELCARAIHHLGKRRNLPFIPVDCSTVPDHLFESELFGHVRGAFTDAHRDQRGLVGMAEGGTLFLDEVDALSLAAQAKLLRLLQEYTYRPLGADRFQRADVNIIAATNQDLERSVRDGGFRSDLYFRLNVLRLHLPPLRERRQDIRLLAVHFLQGRRGAAQGSARQFSAAALHMLASHDWPGNVRELSNVVRRAAVVCDGPRILPVHVALSEPRHASDALPTHFRTARAAAVEAFERRFVEELLRKHDGNVTHAAHEAGKDRRVFGRLMKKYRIARRSI
jgi:two-component system response regulator GlrR